MSRIFFLLASLLSVAAFAPISRVINSNGLKMSYENAIGAQPPLGFWDPLGLLKDADQERFDRLNHGK
jgi:hypothetical protein